MKRKDAKTLRRNEKQRAGKLRRANRVLPLFFTPSFFAALRLGTFALNSIHGIRD